MNEYGKKVAKKMEDYMSNPDSVSEEINDIQNALHGVDVRGALAAGVKKSFSKSESAEGISKNTEQRQDAVEQQFDDVLNEWTSDKPISNEETIAARTNRKTGDNYTTLGQRLDAENKKVTAQLADTEKKTLNNQNKIKDLESGKADKNFTYSELEKKATKEELYIESNAKSDKSYVDKRVRKVNNRIDEIISEPAEGISKQEIVDAREGRTSLGDNVRSIREKAATTLKNQVTNGDFFEGINGHLVFSGSLEVIDGIARVTGDGSVFSTYGGVIAHNLADSIPTNQKWYIRAKVRTIDDDTVALGVGFRGTSGVNQTLLNNPEKNKWYKISHVFDGNGISGLFRTSILGQWTSGNNVGKDIEIEYYMAFNLSETFGRGSEPTKDEMDALLDNFSYFEGDLGSGTLSKYLLEKQIEKQTELVDVRDSKLKNFIVNGDFKKGRIGWTSGTGTSLSVDDGKLTIKGAGGHPIPRVFQKSDESYSSGDMLYVSASFTPKNNYVESVGFAVYSDLSDEENISYLTSSDVEYEKKINVEGIINVPESATGDLRLQLRTVYENATIAEGKEVDVEEFRAYNLTSFFGKGNEPSALAFEKMLRQMPSAKSKIKTDIAETQRALADYILSRTSGNSGSVKRPVFVITFDDGRLSDLEIAMPFLRSRGIKATHYITTNWRDSPDFMSWEQVHELRNAGHDIQGHTKSHPPLGARTIEEIRDEIEATNQDFIDADFPSPRHIALPHGSGWNNQAVLDTLSEYRKTIRNIAAYSPMPYQTWDNFDFQSINSIAGDIRDDNIHLLQRAKNNLLQAYENNGIAVLYLHKIRYEGAQDYEADFKYFAEVVDYALDLDFDVLTLNEVCLEVKNYKRATNQL